MTGSALPGLSSMSFHLANPASGTSVQNRGDGLATGLQVSARRWTDREPNLRSGVYDDMASLSVLGFLALLLSTYQDAGANPDATASLEPPAVSTLPQRPDCPIEGQHHSVIRSQ